MECVIAFLLVFVGVLALGGISALNRLGAGRLDRALKRLSQRYGGTYIAGGWFSAPAIQFHYGNERVPVVVFTGKRGKRRYTHVVIDWPDPHARLEILSRWAYLPDQREFRGLYECTIDAEFDHRYVVLSNDPRDASRTLTDPVKWQVQRLRGFFGDDFIHISVRRGELEIVKQRQVGSYEQVDEFLRSALQLFDQAMLTRSEGIDFVAGGGPVVVQEAVCQVCGEDIVTDMVFCRRCSTPHHLECWQYVGACAIYGCQEKNYVAPHVADSISPGPDTPGDPPASTGETWNESPGVGG